MTCKHEHGAWVADIGLWVCGQCFEKLAEQPKRFGMQTVRADVFTLQQQIVWVAEVRESDAGTTLADFLKAMVRRFMRRAKDLLLLDAYNLAIGTLATVGDEFGDRSYDWSASGAKDMADEEMAYWDHEGGGQN